MIDTVHSDSRRGVGEGVLLDHKSTCFGRGARLPDHFERTSEDLYGVMKAIRTLISIGNNL